MLPSLFLEQGSGLGRKASAGDPPMHTAAPGPMRQTSRYDATAEFVWMAAASEARDATFSPPLTSSRNLFETSHPRRPWQRSFLRPPCFLRGFTSLAPPSGGPVSTAAPEASTRFPGHLTWFWDRHREDPRHCCSRKDVAVMPSQPGDDARRRCPTRHTLHRFRHPCIAPRDFLCTLLRDQCPRRELPSE